MNVKMNVKLLLFTYPSVLTFVLSAQKNRFIETIKGTVSFRRFF